MARMNSCSSWLKRIERIGVISFARNFGHQIAVTAGIDYAGGEAVILIDADLQDPPARYTAPDRQMERRL